ncbi:hypothetical protein Pint_24842 [Pistacia integerrima]|uniref:Uncharacterized protein n=1 Tax=Pistacia integerrima TaxID=434235 RepID=A0ACC0YDB2_9ROSI|nr:hypothetical protein Pint_24842 [Pistacia integerrima]
MNSYKHRRLRRGEEDKFRAVLILTVDGTLPFLFGDNVLQLFIDLYLHEQHQQELENLTLTTQPFKTFKYFILAVVQYLKRSILYLLAKGGWLMLLSTVVVAVGVLLVTIDGSHEKHLEELSEYFRFGLWWIALGVASSIGLGSGLHTFVLYLGPHIALFTIKAMKCGRVDLKSAPYDTIQLKRGPSWLLKDCNEFGSPLYGSQVPLSSILPQVQIEAVLWGIGTALGELPPYFISRAGMITKFYVDIFICNFDLTLKYHRRVGRKPIRTKVGKY